MIKKNGAMFIVSQAGFEVLLEVTSVLIFKKMSPSPSPLYFTAHPNYVSCWSM